MDDPAAESSAEPQIWTAIIDVPLRHVEWMQSNHPQYFPVFFATHPYG